MLRASNFVFVRPAFMFWRPRIPRSQAWQRRRRWVPLMSYQGGPPWPSDAISIESNGISNRSNRKSQKSSNGRKIARMARILTIFGPFESHRRQLQFPKISNERKIIESIESIDSIERSRDRSDRSEAVVITGFAAFFVVPFYKRRAM